jgi:transposase-like protein
MAKRARKSYTEQQRQEILAAATKDGLTALQVQKKFGVTPVTYYSWRKKKGLKGPRGRRPAAAAGGGDLNAQVRAGVRDRVRSLLPGIVREEVASYLDGLFGGSGRRRRRARRNKK